MSKSEVILYGFSFMVTLTCAIIMILSPLGF